ncbi:tRNA 2-thiouridine(34) synthase TusD [Gilliamella sp. wkB178]|uniref:sulfurtransferase complex subunit TusD n=1 Tax=Gilliamella sp. wkB178 TaxID=3120259 RepID=UPI00080E2A86|nr:sulfurtransferase complex subunit TusD [Gilliamella apicola]OCG10203.1 tRNA 2-thiouridine(34) synthase TusD [Gilliamella apicola]
MKKKQPNQINQQNNVIIPLNYAIVVMGPAYGTQSAYCAYQFTQTLVTQTAHTIKNIFFYADGVYNGNSYTDPANDEFDLVSAWQQLAETYCFPLNICVAAAQRRGIIEQNLANHFILTGLSELSEAMAICDRVIQF